MGMDLQTIETPPEDVDEDGGYYRLRTPAMRAMVEAMRIAQIFFPNDPIPVEGAAVTVDEKKFLRNHGDLVPPSECLRIHHMLCQLIEGLNEDDCAAVSTTWTLAEHELLDRLSGQGISLTPLIPQSRFVELDLEQLRDFLQRFADYNRMAADYGGYAIH